MDYETASYLCHHGVKGMKWGVRKDKNRVKNDENHRYKVLKSQTPRKERLSKRKIRKGIRELNNKGREMAKVSDQFDKEMKKTKEWKAQQNTLKSLVALEEEARKRGGRMVYTKDQADAINKTFNDFQQKGKELYDSKYREKTASAYLKDLGYEDTEYGRAYLKRHGFV